MFSLENNIASFQKEIEAYQRELGFAKVVALTRTAFATAYEFLPEEAVRVFDRPTRWTLKGFYARPATKSQETFEVGIKDGGAMPAAKFLRAEVFGGSRRQKRSERALTLSGLMGDAGFWVPGPGVRLDAYGNIPGGTMRRILSDLKADRGAGYDANRSTRSTKRNKRYAQERYFVPKAGSKLHPGVWVRRGAKIAPALLFVNAVSYDPRFDLFGKGRQFAAQRFRTELARAVAEGWDKPKP
jgi:hypothetical protein